MGKIFEFKQLTRKILETRELPGVAGREDWTVCVIAARLLWVFCYSFEERVSDKENKVPREPRQQESETGHPGQRMEHQHGASMEYPGRLTSK